MSKYIKYKNGGVQADFTPFLKTPLVLKNPPEKYVSVSVALNEDRDDFKEAFKNISTTVWKVVEDLPLGDFDCGYGFGTRDFEWEVLEGDRDELQKIVRDRVREAGLEVVER